MDSLVLVDKIFDSFEQLSEIVSHWDTDFRQLTREDFKSRLFQAKTDLLLISNAQFGCVVDQKGNTPMGMRTFALPRAGCPEFHWFAHQSSQNDLLIFPANGEVDAFSHSGFSVITFSIPEIVLSEQIELLNQDINKVIPKSGTIINLPENCIMALHHLLSQLEYLIRNQSLQLDSQAAIESIQTQFIKSLLNVLTKTPSQLIRHRTRQAEKLQLLLNYIYSHMDNPISVKDLCQVSGFSERNIQNLFKKQLGILPKSFISGHKLYQIHKKLWHVQQSTLKIFEVASEFGFWHMGQLASDYKKQFGELPSETLIRKK